MSDLYRISLPGYRRSSLDRLKENRKAYNSLTNKDGLYAKQMKALHDLHIQVYEIYKNAPDQLGESK